MGRAWLLARLLEPLGDGGDRRAPLRRGRLGARGGRARTGPLGPGRRASRASRGGCRRWPGMADGDLIYASKPRLTSAGVGYLARLGRRRPLLLDIDDWEVGFFLRGGVWGTIGRALNLSNPRRACVDVADGAPQGDAPTASRSASRFLEQRFGGVLIPHVRDTDRWAPGRADPAAARERLGVDKRARRHVPRHAPRPQGRGGSGGRRWSGWGAPTSCWPSSARSPRSATGRGRWAPGIRESASSGGFPFDEVPGFLVAADVVAVPQRETQRHAGPGAREALRRHGPRPADRLHARVDDPGDPRRLRRAGPARRRGRARGGHRAPARPARRGARARAKRPGAGRWTATASPPPGARSSPWSSACAREAVECASASSAGRSSSTAASRPRPRASWPPLRHAGHDVDLISTRRQASVPGARGAPRADAAAIPPCSVCLVRWPRRAPPRRATDTTSCRATSARCARTSTARARAATRAYLEAMRRKRRRASRRTIAWSWRSSGASSAPHRAAHRGDLAAGKEEIERLYGSAAGARDRRSTTGSISSASIPTTAAATARPRARRSGIPDGRVDRALRRLGLRAQGPGPPDRGVRARSPTRTAGWS